MIIITETDFLFLYFVSVSSIHNQPPHFLPNAYPLCYAIRYCIFIFSFVFVWMRPSYWDELKIVNVINIIVKLAWWQNHLQNANRKLEIEKRMELLSAISIIIHQKKIRNQSTLKHWSAGVLNRNCNYYFVAMNLSNVYHHKIGLFVLLISSSHSRSNQVHQ